MIPTPNNTLKSQPYKPFLKINYSFQVKKKHKNIKFNTTPLKCPHVTELILKKIIPVPLNTTNAFYEKIIAQ